jgi:hypothetical protein
VGDARRDWRRWSTQLVDCTDRPPVDRNWILRGPNRGPPIGGYEYSQVRSLVAQIRCLGYVGRPRPTDSSPRRRWLPRDGRLRGCYPRCSGRRGRGARVKAASKKTKLAVVPTSRRCARNLFNRWSGRRATSACYGTTPWLCQSRHAPGTTLWRARRLARGADRATFSEPRHRA